MPEKYVARDQNPKFVRVKLPWKLKTQEDNNDLPVIVVDSYDRTAVCIDIFTGCVPPKTA